MENQRIRISKIMLKQALLDLLQKTSISKITVSELCANAQINRTTFYKYYHTPNDVLKEIEWTILTELEQALQAYDGSSHHLCHALEYLRSQKSIIITLIHTIPIQELTDTLFSLPSVKRILHPQIPDTYSASEAELVYLFICQGCYAVIQQWLCDNCTASPETIADFLHRLAVKTLHI